MCKAILASESVFRRRVIMVLVACLLLGPPFFETRATAGESATAKKSPFKGPKEEATGPSLSGTVLDPSGQPVADAIVASCSPYSGLFVTRTDSRGCFRLAPYRGGAVMAEKAGFAPGFEDITVGEFERQWCKSTPPKAMIRLNKGGAISGTVTSGPTGQSIAGAEVWLQRPGKGRVLGHPYVAWCSDIAVTDQKGRFVFEHAPTGPLRVKTRAEGFTAGTTTWFLLEEADAIEKNLVLVPKTEGVKTGTIRGAITSESTGQPIAEVSVWLQRPDYRSSRDNVAYARTDEKGRFVFEHVAEGWFRLKARLQGQEEFGKKTTTRFQLKREQSLNKNLIMKLTKRKPVTKPVDWSISGTVVDRSGRPVPGATVVNYFYDGGNLFDQKTQTDDNGRFRFEKRIGFHTKAERKGFAPGFSQITPKEYAKRAPIRRTITLNSGGAIKGRLTLEPTGQVIAGASVFLEKPREQWTSEVVTTDDQGRFVFEHVPTGTIRIRAKKKPLVEKTTADFVVKEADNLVKHLALRPKTPEETLRERLLEARRGRRMDWRTDSREPCRRDSKGRKILDHSIEGIVVNAQGAPVVGAEIRNCQPDGSVAQHALTDSTGRFRFAELDGPFMVAESPGRAAVLLKCGDDYRDYRRHQRCSHYREDKPFCLNIMFRKGRVMEGTIRRPVGDSPVAGASVWIEQWACDMANADESIKRWLWIHKKKIGDVRHAIWRSDSVKTDIHGRFRISHVPDGRLRLRASADGIGENERSVVTIGKMQGKEIDLRLHKGVELTVEVLDARTRQPLPGLIVSLDGRDGVKTTGGDGTCVFRDVVSGEYVVGCRVEGGRNPIYKRVTIARSGAEQKARLWVLRGRATSGEPDDRNHFTGWFRLSGQKDPKPLIPIFKVGKTYYTVSRGVEIPLAPCPKGLRWAAEPAEIGDVRIGFDKASKKYFLTIGGQKRSMTKIDKPPKLFDPTTEPPRTDDEFVGWLQSVWRPDVVWEIRKGDSRYYGSKYLISAEPDALKWPRTNTGKCEIVRHPDRLGFIVHQTADTRDSITYNDALKRFEYTRWCEKDRAALLRMPLVRISTLPEARATMASERIGIPVTDFRSDGKTPRRVPSVKDPAR